MLSEDGPKLMQAIAGMLWKPAPGYTNSADTQGIVDSNFFPLNLNLHRIRYYRLDHAQKILEMQFELIKNIGTLNHINTANCGWCLLDMLGIKFSGLGDGVVENSQATGNSGNSGRWVSWAETQPRRCSVDTIC